MKILLVTDKPELKEQLTYHLSPRGFDFITYINPIKAMDNIEEIAPDVVIFSTEDYPRHWKTFLQYLRFLRNRDETIFILTSKATLEYEEAAKAIFLGVNGILSEDFEEPKNVAQLDGILTRYKLIKDSRKAPRYIPEAYDSIDFVFNHPNSMKLITGSVRTISISGASFLPDSPRLTSDLKIGTKIPHCSLKFGDRIISFSGEIIRNNKLIIFSFPELSPEEKDVLIEYIEESSSRNLESRLSEEQETDP